jgi:hypothetical protein
MVYAEDEMEHFNGDKIFNYELDARSVLYTEPALYAFGTNLIYFLGVVEAPRIILNLE